MTEAAFFDLDKTIIAKSSTLAFTKPLFEAGMLNRRTLAKAGIAQAYYQIFGADHDQLERVKEELAQLTSGWDREEIVALAEGIDLEESYAYSDSATDVPMLELVGHPVAVNPDTELAAIAKEREWEIREFESPVSLRDRLSDNKVPSAALVAYSALKGRRDR